jgi:osmoprotectant transport system ATP-binding protein
MDVSWAVELRQVSRVFAGEVRAVDDVSLQVPAGRVVALLGPSGCGKTTTLRLINRLEEPTRGEVFVRGQDVRAQRPEALRRSIGYVIQDGGLFPHLDVWANVATVPRLLGWERSRIARRVGEVLEMIGLPEQQFGRRKPAELSGGQRQRVGVARALAADPDILLMDEPFGALDPGTREALQDEFHSLNVRLHKTVILVTHDLAEAARLADDLVLLDRGRVAQRGTLHDLLFRPAGEAVRSFLGRRAPWLALEVVRLGEIVAGLETTAAGADARRLSPDLPLGRALVELADAAAEATVILDSAATQAFSARALRQRIMAELDVAGRSRDNDEMAAVWIRGATNEST